MRRRMAHLLFVLPVAVTLALALSVLVLSAQLQPVVPDIGFEVEGNTALDQGGDFDWENTEFPPAIHIPDPNSKIETDDTVFKPDSKFDDPAGWRIKAGKVGPGQSELVNFLVWDIRPGALGDGRPNDHWLVLGMERIKVPGYFEMDFEYNQVAWDGTSGGPERTTSDVLVGFELRGKPTSNRAAFKVLLLQYWPDAQPSLCSTTLGPGGEPELVEVGTDPCPPYGGSGWYYRLLADDALSVTESGLVQATMNKDPFYSSWSSTEIGPYQFAEAAINLTALGIEPDCTDPGSVHAKSRSAPHVHSDLKDLVGPIPLECAARLDGYKFEDANGNGQWDPDEDPLERWEIRLSDGSVTHTDSDGYYAFEDLDNGTYTVSEACPQGEDWVQTMPTPDDPNSCGEAVYTVTLDGNIPEVNDLDFGNHWPAARLDGHKFEDTNGNGIWDTGELPLAGWEIRLSDGSVTYTNADGHYAFEDLDYGTYTVSEVCPQVGGWYQTVPLPSDPNDPWKCDGVHTVELDSGTPEFNDLDFGNVPGPTVELKVSKDVQTSFTRTYQWTLDKTVDNEGPILLYPGDYADVEYRVVAGLDSPAYVDSDWTVEGTISILNDWFAPVPLEWVSDVITPGDIKVPVDCGWGPVEGGGVSGVVLWPGESLTCSYSYGPDSLLDGSALANTVTVTVLGSAQEFTSTADIVFDQPTTEIDKEARVTDTNWEDEQWEDPEWVDIWARDTPWVFTYPWRLHATGQLCMLLDYPNTATLVTSDTGTELTAEANVQIREACQAQITIAYEDLRLGIVEPETERNDWDYNDLLVHVPISLTVSDAGDLEAVSFEATVEPIRTAFSHVVNLQPYDWFCDCSGTYTRVVTDRDGTSTTSRDEPYEPGDNLLLIQNTRTAGDDAEFRVELTIDFDVEASGDCPYSFRDPVFGDPDPVNQYHGEWLFFDPWITVHRPEVEVEDYDIHVLKHLPEEPAPEPRILTVPADWDAPAEDWVPIWDVYISVCEPADPDRDPPIFTPYWWLNETPCTQ